MPLTDTACKNAKKRNKEYKLADSQGLYLLVKPNGGKYWRLKYRVLRAAAPALLGADAKDAQQRWKQKWKEKLLTLGVYPKVGLADARKRREAARDLIAAGVDPSQVKKEEKQRQIADIADTFELAAREWHKNSLTKWKPQYADEVLNRLENDFFPEIGNLPVRQLTPTQALDAVRKVENRGALDLARRTRQYGYRVYRYLKVLRRADQNPFADLTEVLKPKRRTKHYAAISLKEIPEFLQKLISNDARLFPITRLAIWLMMLTFVRTSEFITSTKDEVDRDGGLWEIPGHRMKMQQPHIVPLSRQSLAGFEVLFKYQAEGNWLFPSMAKPGDHISNNTILYGLKRLGYKGKMTGHGFRALAMSTIKEKLGYRHEVVDRQLAHAHRDETEAAYDRAKFLDERTKMMQDWADYLDSLAPMSQMVATIAQSHWRDPD